MKERFEQLDSLRGIAALTVVLGHCITLFYRQSGEYGYYSNSVFKFIIEQTPFTILFGAHQAVVFFFVLSGFVLSLQFYKQNVNYKEFLIKRFFRIYVPYYFVIVLFLVSFNMWGKIPLNTLIGHLFLIGNFDYNAVLGVIWSLVHEMRISIIFPIVVFIVLKLDWIGSICVIFIVSSIASKLHYVFYANSDSTISYIDSLHFLTMFIMGALLAKKRDVIVGYFSKLSPFSKSLVIVAGVLLYINYIGGKFLFYDINFLYDLNTMIGASLFIISALSFNKVKKLLEKKLMVFLGKISYSLYLCHLFIISMVKINFAGVIPVPIQMLMSIFCSLLLASILFYLVEIPSIQLGVRITSKLRYMGYSVTSRR